MKDNKKILIFSLAYHPFVGGAEVAVKKITDRLGDDFQFEMITANLDGRQKEEEEIGKIKIYRTSLFSPPYEGGGLGEVKKIINKYLFPWLAYKKAIALQKGNNYNLIWAMMANQAGWAALKFKKKFSTVKYLLTLQEGDSEWDIWLRTFFIRPIYKSIYRQADYIQAISNFLAERAKNMGAKCPIEVVPNGVKSQKSKVKSQNFNSKFKIITVSRLVIKNGIEDLIKSIKLLITSYQLPVILTIIGDGKLCGELERLAEDLKIRDKINFVGVIQNEEVYKHLIEANIFVRPSLSEGLGNAFLEAMSVGVPVIGTSVGGIPDFLKEGKTGWFCEVKNPKSIAEKINYILAEKNQEEVKGVVENARKMVEEKYNWDKIVIQMKNIFSKL